MKTKILTILLLAASVAWGANDTIVGFGNSITAGTAASVPEKSYKDTGRYQNQEPGQGSKGI